MKRIIKIVFVTIAFMLLLAVALVAPIDRTPLQEQPFYQDGMKMLDTLTIPTETPRVILAGWTKVNITPRENMPMAGYIVRDHFDSVHDSLFIRIMLFKTETQTIALINADLLLFPPVLKEQLITKLESSLPHTFLYLSATHNHNGIGGWDDSLVGQLAIGDFNEAWINQTTESIANALHTIQTKPASIQYWESNAEKLVVNRIAYGKGKKDGVLRGFTVTRQDSLSACLFTFSAHATTLSRFNKTLSADYPAETIQLLEQEFSFGMFMAGMMGSHSFDYQPEREYALVKREGLLLHESFQQRTAANALNAVTVQAAHVPIPFGPSQLRIHDEWKTRNWAFTAFLAELEGEFTYLRLGNVLMIGTPCDFSGEIAVNEKLHDYARAKGLNLIITSFNGNYVGYITHDGHYDSIHRTEVREMNWVGPYYGKYFSEMIKRLIDKSEVKG
jgi:neutral ceramidase